MAKRIFLSIILAALLPLAAATTAADESKSELRLYTVGYAHLDTQWRWDYRTVIDQYLPATITDNFALFAKYPNYVFNFSGANRYRMMQEYFPDQFAKVKKYVAEGRWFPCGSSWEESDVLAPSAESIIRQILYGTRYFRRELGKSSREYMLPDCFGFPASLPSLLAHCGLSGFSTQKLTWGSAVGIPFNLGRWLGPDGKGVIASFNPGDYVGRIREDLSRSEKWAGRIHSQGQASGIFAEYMYFGVGDRGGAPDEESVRYQETSLKGNGPVRVQSTTADQLFADLEKADLSRLPVFQGELLLTEHSAGSITSAAAMKRWNRKNEILAAAAEELSVLAWWLTGLPPDRRALEEAWELILGAQFHDILPGTSIPRAYDFSWNDEIVAANRLQEVIRTAAGRAIAVMDTRSKGVPLVVFNPSAWEREEVVEASVSFDREAPVNVQAFANGQAIPTQWTPSGKKGTLLFPARVPALGLATFDIRPAAAVPVTNSPLQTDDRRLENNRYRIIVNDAGDIAGIYDKGLNRELLKAPIRLVFLDENPRTYPAWNMDWQDRNRPISGSVTGPARIRIVESGPVRATLEIERESRGSTFRQRIRLTAGGEPRVEIANRIIWNTGGVSLKAEFPFTIANPEAVYNNGIGIVSRKNNDPKKFEVPSHRWIDLAAPDGSYGVTLLDDCKYGSDKPADHTLRLTLLYTPRVRSSFQEQAYQDFGIHEMTYAICGHEGDWRRGMIDRRAESLNCPLIPFQTIPHSGPAGSSVSLLSIPHPHIQVLTCKPAEDGNDVILRLVERSGSKLTGASVHLPFRPKAIREVNGLEDTLAPIDLAGKDLRIDLTPHQIRTFALRFSPRFPQPKILSAPLTLPLNHRVISRDDTRGQVDGDTKGRSYPDELLPDTLESAGISFRIGAQNPGGPDVLICRGQTIPLPRGNWNRLYLLAASLDGDRPLHMKIGDQPQTLAIQDWTGMIGQWDKRIWSGIDNDHQPEFDWRQAEFLGLEPGFIKPAPLALFTTHRHHRTAGNEAYMYTYLYRYVIDLPPPGPRAITLPDDPALAVFAATAANELYRTEPAVPLFDLLERDPADFGRFQRMPRPTITPEIDIITPGSALTVNMTAPAGTIRYTLDGNEPTASSAPFTSSFQVRTQAVIRCATFSADRIMSDIVHKRLFMSLPLPAAELTGIPSPRYTGQGAKTLIDARRGSTDIRDGNWLGFEGTDLEVTVDLGNPTRVNRVTLGLMHSPGDWIYLPESIEFSVSRDGKRFASIDAVVKPAIDTPDGIHEFGTAGSVDKIRCIRIRARNRTALPDGYTGEGGKVWIFADEIMVE